MPIPIVEDVYQCQVIFHSVGGHENVFTNTLYFRDDAAVKRSFGDVADLLDTKLTGFYNVAQGGGGNRIMDFISRVTDASLTTLKVYDLNESAPRIPEIRPMTVTQSGTTTILPNECAVVLSYRSGAATNLGGSIDPTKRGRIYIGPLTSSSATFTVGTDWDARVNSGLITTLELAAEWLVGDTDGDEMTWVQYSLKENRALAVTGGFINNRLDTQRRRGEPESSRTVWS